MKQIIVAIPHIALDANLPLYAIDARSVNNDLENVLAVIKDNPEGFIVINPIKHGLHGRLVIGNLRQMGYEVFESGIKDFYLLRQYQQIPDGLFRIRRVETRDRFGTLIDTKYFPEQLQKYWFGIKKWGGFDPRGCYAYPTLVEAKKDLQETIFARIDQRHSLHNTTTTETINFP